MNNACHCTFCSETKFWAVLIIELQITKYCLEAFFVHENLRPTFEIRENGG